VELVLDDRDEFLGELQVLTAYGSRVGARCILRQRASTTCALDRDVHKQVVDLIGREELPGLSLLARLGSLLASSLLPLAATLGLRLWVVLGGWEMAVRRVEARTLGQLSDKLLKPLYAIFESLGDAPTFIVDFTFGNAHAPKHYIGSANGYVKGLLPEPPSESSFAENAGERTRSPQLGMCVSLMTGVNGYLASRIIGFC